MGNITTFKMRKNLKILGVPKIPPQKKKNKEGSMEMIYERTGNASSVSPMLKETWRRLLLVLLTPILVVNALDAAEPSILKFDESFQVELVNNRMTQDDAKRAFAFAKDYLYGLKKSYTSARTAFEEIGRYYGRELADDCLLWRAKSLFALGHVCYANMVDLLYQVATMYPDGDVYSSRQFPDALRECIRGYGTGRNMNGNVIKARPVGGVLQLYELLKAHPLVEPAELKAIKTEVVDFLRSDRAQGFMVDCMEARRLFLRTGPYLDAHDRKATKNEWLVYTLPTIKFYIVSDLGAFLTPEKGFNDSFFGAMAERAYNELSPYIAGDYVWNSEECCYAWCIHSMSLTGLCSKSNPSELIYGDITPPVLREVLEAHE
jgi:hypothetical protein